MDLSTKYLGLALPHPFMPGASPMVGDLDQVKRLEEAGAAAIVMNSLFEEQIVYEQMTVSSYMENSAYFTAEAQTFFPDNGVPLGPEEYLSRLQKVVDTVEIPVIGSLNGTSKGRWLEYAMLIQQAGASAIELNMYALRTDPEQSAARVEEETLEIVEAVAQSVSVPLAIKLSPYYTALSNFANRLAAGGTDGLVLFNRFYQADIDVEELEIERTLRLSDSSTLLLRLRWLAVLSSQIDISLAVTGGVHTSLDAIKAILTGADAVQMTSALLAKGPEYLGTILKEVTEWLDEHEYESLAQARGSMNHERCPNPAAYERANYMDILSSWKPELS